MAGEAEPARMGEALAVAEQKIGGRGERRQGLERRRDLAKRQQARNVGKTGRTAGERALDHEQSRQAENRDRGTRDLARLLEADVDASDQSDLAEPVLELDLAGQRQLQLARLGRAQIPGVAMGGRQRHARRSRASPMIRTVSDQSPSPSTSSRVNQRASAASPPGRRSDPAASALKSIRV